MLTIAEILMINFWQLIFWQHKEFDVSTVCSIPAGVHLHTSEGLTIIAILCIGYYNNSGLIGIFSGHVSVAFKITNINESTFVNGFSIKMKPTIKYTFRRVEACFTYDGVVSTHNSHLWSPPKTHLTEIQ